MANKETNYEEDLDQINFNNYKGIFYNEDTNQKYQDKATGAHFEYFDMILRLKRVQKEIKVVEATQESVKQNAKYKNNNDDERKSPPKNLCNESHRFGNHDYSTAGSKALHKEINLRIAKNEVVNGHKKQASESSRLTKDLNGLKLRKESTNKSNVLKGVVSRLNKKSTEAKKRESDINEEPKTKTIKSSYKSHKGLEVRPTTGGKIINRKYREHFNT